MQLLKNLRPSRQHGNLLLGILAVIVALLLGFAIIAGALSILNGPTGNQIVMLGILAVIGVISVSLALIWIMFRCIRGKKADSTKSSTKILVTTFLSVTVAFLPVIIQAQQPSYEVKVTTPLSQNKAANRSKLDIASPVAQNVRLVLTENEIKNAVNAVLEKTGVSSEDVCEVEVVALPVTADQEKNGPATSDLRLITANQLKSWPYELPTQFTTPNVVLPLWCVVILAAIVVIVAGVIIYIIIKICKKLKHILESTNEPPNDPYPAFWPGGDRSVGLSSLVLVTNDWNGSLFSGDLPEVQVEVQSSVTQDNWGTYCYVSIGVSNGTALVTIKDSNNVPLQTNSSALSPCKFNSSGVAVSTTTVTNGPPFRENSTLMFFRVRQQ